MALIIGTISSSVQKAAGAFESIATTTGAGSSGTVTFSSIPSTYQHLQIRTSFLMTGNYGGNLLVILNSDTATNYSYHLLQGGGSSTFATGSANQSFMYGSYTNAAVNNAPTVCIIDIHDYASTSKNKTIRTFSGTDSNGGGYGQAVSINSGLWRSTSAIDSITLYYDQGGTGYFSTTSSFALYGIKGA